MPRPFLLFMLWERGCQAWSIFTVMSILSVRISENIVNRKAGHKKISADAVDVDRANISGIENGERGVMNCVMLKRFARALGVSMDTLMDEEDEPPCADTSIQEKYDMLNPMHQEMVRESIDCYLLKEQKVAI